MKTDYKCVYLVIEVHNGRLLFFKDPEENRVFFAAQKFPEITTKLLKTFKEIDLRHVSVNPLEKLRICITTYIVVVLRVMKEKSLISRYYQLLIKLTRKWI